MSLSVYEPNDCGGVFVLGLRFGGRPHDWRHVDSRSFQGRPYPGAIVCAERCASCRRVRVYGLCVTEDEMREFQVETEARFATEITPSPAPEGTGRECSASGEG